MVSSSRARASINLKMLEFVARKLGKLNNQVVYLGGCSTALFITDPCLHDIRPTKDVDCIVDIISKSDYYKFVDKLAEQGFKQSSQDEFICRWRYDDAVLDIMPINAEILGFSNRWYKKAIDICTPHTLASDLTINAVTAPYLIATKIEAFKERGNNDFYSSHDLEDIITIVDGRFEIVGEILQQEDELKFYLQSFFRNLMQDDNFLTALPGHVGDDRLQIMYDRINKIIG